MNKFRVLFNKKLYPNWLIRVILFFKIISKIGTSGSYFLESTQRKKVGIFKPFDEEAFAPKNPKGYHGRLGQVNFLKNIFFQRRDSEKEFNQANQLPEKWLLFCSIFQIRNIKVFIRSLQRLMFAFIILFSIITINDTPYFVNRNVMKTMESNPKINKIYKIN